MSFFFFFSFKKRLTSASRIFFEVLFKEKDVEIMHCLFLNLVNVKDKKC